MRSKAPLVLMEQLVMVLVFALAAALCIQAFAVSGHLSRSGEAQDQAVILAQSAAETYKACHGDPVRVMKTLGGTVSQEGWYALFDQKLAPVNSSESAVYAVEVEAEMTDVQELGMASVKVHSVESRELLIRLTVAWQEVPDVA